MALAPLANPERAWERARSIDTVDLADVESRIGKIDGDVQVLSGGQANLNLKIGADRVLRIFRRDRTAIRRESSLLRGGWTSFVVPRILQEGDDFLLMAYVRHGPVADAAEWGTRIGTALARHPVLLHGDFKPANVHTTASGDLLVLDWEFSYAGPALMDIGQLMRWQPSAPFRNGFAEGYQKGGGVLPPQWERWADAFDLYNLLALLSRATPGSKRAKDLVGRIERTVAALALG